MFGFIIGTLCLIGLFATLRARRWGYGYGGGGCYRGGAPYYVGPPWERPWGHRRPSPRSFLREAFARLDTTPGQEKAIVAIVEEAREQARGLRGELAQLRKEVAALLGSEALDRDQLEACVASVQTVTAQLGDAVSHALAAVHEVLDQRQRRTLSELLADGSLSRSAYFGY